jgi:hypothetical protein
MCAALSRRALRGVPTRRRVALGLVTIIGIAWAIPGPVVAHVARQEPLLLGRYAAGHFAALALGTVVLGLVAALLWNRRSLGESVLLASLALGSAFAGVVVVSSFARVGIAPRYQSAPLAKFVKDPALRARLGGNVTTREANFRWELVREDLPAPGRSYPQRVAGHPALPVVLTTDDRGLRNPPRAGRYDVVVAGDSFTEGSMVSDEQTWWSLLARQTGLRVYNTGVSGLTVREYLNNWVAFGLDSGARTLIVTIYEGNDWKPLGPAPATSAAAHVAPAARHAGVFGAGLLDRVLDFAWNTSPLRSRAELALVQLLAPIGADWPLPPSLALSWMPATVTAGGATHHYAWEPKHMMRLDWEPAAFAAAPEWTTNEVVLRQLADLARERGVRLIVAYAPSKPHVVLPLLRDAVSAAQLRAFAALRDRADELLPTEAFRDRLYRNLDTQENTLRDWCAGRGVDFVSLTALLRERIAEGVPAYFTYDPHWSDEGHAAVAVHLAATLFGGSPERHEGDTH